MRQELELITTERLNLLLLERQWLTKTFLGDPLELIKSHGVIQTQERFSGEEFLRSRGVRTPGTLDHLRASGEVVKATLHRCTVHTMAKDDFLRWQPLYADKLEKTLFRKGWTLREDWREEVERLLGDGVYKAKELHDILMPLFPYPDMLFVVRGFIGLIRVPLEEGADGGGFELFTLPPSLRRHEPEELLEAKKDLARRYLGAFGPALAADFAAWSGLTGAAEVFKNLENELWRGVNEDGKILYDLKEADRTPTTTAPRYGALPFFDNIVLGLGDRSRIADFTADEKDEFFKGAMAPLLVDGQVRGSWVNRVSGGKTRVLLKEIKPLTGKDKKALEAEVEKLMADGRRFTKDFKWVKSFLGA